MPFCSQCGAEVDEKTKFCPECGAPIKKREKRAAVIPPINLPPPKTAHSGAHAAKYSMERAEGASSNQRGPASEIQRSGGEPMPPTGAAASRGEGTSEQTRRARNDELKGKLVAGIIIAGVLIAVPWMVLGYPIWEIFSDGGGGGGSINWDGTYYGDTVTVSPMGTTSGSGSFTVYNGYVSEGWFQGSVDSGGWFTGTIIISEGSPAMNVTGQFSLTDTFTLYGEYGSSNWTCYAYKG